MRRRQPLAARGSRRKTAPQWSSERGRNKETGEAYKNTLVQQRMVTFHTAWIIAERTIDPL